MDPVTLAWRDIDPETESEEAVLDDAYIVVGAAVYGGYAYDIEVTVENHTRFEQDWRTVFAADGDGFATLADAKWAATRRYARYLIAEDVAIEEEARFWEAEALAQEEYEERMSFMELHGDD